MLLGMFASEINGKPVVEIPAPKLLRDSNGEIIRGVDGRPAFSVKASRADFQQSPTSPIKQAFIDRFIIGNKERASLPQLAVIFELTKATSWAEAGILINSLEEAELTQTGMGQAVIKTLGNITSTRTLYDLELATGYSYGTIQRALSFWEAKGVLTRIKPKKKFKKKELLARQAGRPVEYFCIEFDPAYVWDGFIWLGTGYENLLFGKLALKKLD